MIGRRSPSTEELLAARRLLTRAERAAVDDVLAIRAEATRLLDDARGEADRIRIGAQDAGASQEGTSPEAELALERAALADERAHVQDQRSEIEALLVELTAGRSASPESTNPAEGTDQLMREAEEGVAALAHLRDELQAQLDALAQAATTQAALEDQTAALASEQASLADAAEQLERQREAATSEAAAVVAEAHCEARTLLAAATADAAELVAAARKAGIAWVETTLSAVDDARRGLDVLQQRFEETERAIGPAEGG